MKDNSLSKKQFTLFEFFSMTILLTISIFEYTVFATSGFSLVFFILFGAIFWFIPLSLCCAEMATIIEWESGGIFKWISHTLGAKWGFIAVFFQWFQSTIGFVFLLYFVVGTLSYLFQWPALNTNPYIKFFAITIIFWVLTFSQLGGTKLTTKYTKVGLIIGVFIPIFILIGLTIAYIFEKNPMNIKISIDSFFPDFKKINSLVVMISFILSYTGIEASASHINRLKNPNRNYPLVILMIIVTAMFLNIFGGLSIAIVVPLSKLKLSTGINEVFEILITSYGEKYFWIVRLIAGALSLGAMGEICAWIIGPTQGMYEVAEKGFLPSVFTHTNKNDVPVALLILQGIVVTIWGAIITFGGGGKGLSFMIAITLTIIVYLLVYLLLFTSYFILIFKYPHLKRIYEIPGGKVCKLILASSGIIVGIVSFIISFLPPSYIKFKERYVILLVISFLITFVLPFIIYKLKKM